MSRVPSDEHGRGRSETLFEQARGLIPGGVNSPVRAFRAVGGSPVFVESGRGCRVRDVDGREYVDFLGSWGPLILGHADPRVVEALQEAVAQGTSFGMPTEWESRLARLVVERVPGVDRVRFVNSGTEATMSALRLARAATGRDLVVKMSGCYHGHVDALLVQAGSGIATFGLPGSPGVPPSVTAMTISVPFNDVAALEEVFRSDGERIACVILEPVAGNMGVVPPARGYLEAVREITRRNGALFVCDEVMTGFRVSRGGALERYGVTADLVTLGKILGGGLPVAAYAGPAGLMDRLAPEGDVYQAGTLSGNPLAMRAGIATLSALSAASAYDRLETLSARLADGLAAASSGMPVCFNRVGSMMTAFFTPGPVTDFDSASASDTAAYARFFRGMLRRGVFFAPSQFEAAFVSLAHGEADVDAAVEAARETFGEMRRDG